MFKSCLQVISTFQVYKALLEAGVAVCSEEKLATGQVRLQHAIYMLM